MPTPLTDTEQTSGTFVGRVWLPDVEGPAVVILREGELFDITSHAIPTVSALLAHDDPAKVAREAGGRAIGTLSGIAENSAPELRGTDQPHLLAPCDLQVIKACGVTFAQSMIERVIEEKAAGDPDRAEAIRARVVSVIGDNLSQIEAGSDAAQAVKRALIEEDMWSQYLEVGIGPDAEVFTKSPVLSAVGWGDRVGLHPKSKWNNPEPEIVLAVDGVGRIKGATLGNDVNLRDIEGRSALLLGKAKDNNASCAIGPFIRLFDEGYGLADVREAELDLTITGPEGFTLKGHSAMREISRDPEELVRQTIGGHHQYPDGFVLFLGTLFAPTQDRDAPGQGFTHKVGDHVAIACPGLGTLDNTVALSPDCPPWTFGMGALMRNLAARNLL